VATGAPDAARDGSDAPCPSTGTWPSLVPGPGQSNYDPALASAVAKYDRLHESLMTYATGLAGSVTVRDDPAMRQKLAHLLATPWDPNDTDPTDDLLQYENLDPKAFATGFGLATGMYAGSEIAADAFRYGVLRDRGGSCTEVARARKMLQLALEGFHALVTLPGTKGSIARGIARRDLPGDGQSTVMPLFDANHQPLPTEKNNGAWRDDFSPGGQYPNLIWIDSCSRDMLFGWTFGAAAAWEVIEKDPTIDAAMKARLKADAKGVLDGLMIVRPSGKDLELWDPDGRRAYHGNLHESSIDRDYVLENGPASMMALGEVAGLVSIVSDATATAYLQSLVTQRGLVDAMNQSMFVVALGGDASNHSAYNMLFMTAWMAHRYIDDPNVRQQIKKPVEQDLYSPIVGVRPRDWKQSFFDFVLAASTGDAWVHGGAKTTYDAAAVARGLETLSGFAPAPFYGSTVENCDASEIAAGSCLLNDGVTTVSLKTVKWGLVGDTAVPMKVRPPSNFYWRTDPFLVNGSGDPNTLIPGSDIRSSYWLGRWVRIAP
jgi:hypothetical protein